MAISDEQRELVQSSFSRIVNQQDEVAALFYSRLFELDPNVKPLFKGDMYEQGRKLMQMISVAVNGLNRLDALVPAVKQLGERHVGYGVQPVHYDTVGAALLWTLEQGLKEDFTPETRAAWTEVYVTLVGVMTGNNN